MGLRRFFARNTIIVIAHALAASLLLFCCFFFFFQNLRMFWKDMTSYMLWAPILFVAGVSFIFFYIITLVTNIDSKTPHNADRYDLAYKIVFSLTLILLIVRSFVGDFMCTDSKCGEWRTSIVNGIETQYQYFCHGSMLNVPIYIIVLALISGLLTWILPKVKDNDNSDF